MPNIHNITSDDILNLLFLKGFEVSHQRGSHIQLKKDNLRVTIPNHGKKSLNIKTIYSILRQSGLDKKDLV